jgi:hypothetical protein
MSLLTTITTSVAAATGSALLALGAVAALGSASAAGTPAPGSDVRDTVIRPAGIILNGVDRAPADVIPAATAIEYGLIAAADTSVDHSSTAHIGVLTLSPRH